MRKFNNGSCSYWTITVDSIKVHNDRMLMVMLMLMLMLYSSIITFHWINPRDLTLIESGHWPLSNFKPKSVHRNDTERRREKTHTLPEKENWRNDHPNIARDEFHQNNVATNKEIERPKLNWIHLMEAISPNRLPSLFVLWQI